MIWRLLSVALVAGFFGVLGVWVGDRDIPVVQLEARLVNSQARQGDRLLLREVVNRRKLCSSQVERVLFDSQRVRFVLEDLNFAAPVGGPGPDDYITPIPIPVQMAPGLAALRVHKIYRCNPVHWLWPIWADGIDATFEVTPGPEYQRVDPVPNTR